MLGVATVGRAQRPGVVAYMHRARRRGVLLIVLFIHAVSCNTSERQGARAALRQCMDLQGAGFYAESDSLAQIAYAFYSLHGNKEQRMFASYCLAEAEYGKGEPSDATCHFLESRQWAQACGDLRMEGFSCQRLAELFMLAYDHVSAASYARSAIRLLEVSGEPSAANYSRVHLARQHLALGNPEKAEALADSLLATCLQDEGLSYYAYLLKADIHFHQEDYASAEKLYQQAAYTGYPLPVAKQEKQALASLRMGHLLDASAFLEKLTGSTVTPQDTLSVMELCRELALSSGDYREAYSTLLQENGRQYDLLTRLLSGSMAHTVDLYYSTQQRLLQQHRQALHLKYLLLLLLVSIGTVAISLVLREKSMQVIRELDRIDCLTRDLRLLKTQVRGADSLLEAMVQDKIITMQRLTETYFSWTDAAVFLRESQQGKAPREEIIDTFRNNLRELRRDNHFIPSLERALNLTYDNLILKLRKDIGKKHFRKLNVHESDISFLILIYSGFSNKSIGFLLDMTDDAVRTRKKTFKQLFLSMEPGERSGLYL